MEACGAEIKILAFLNRNHLKYIVIVLMVLDHFSFFMAQDNPIVFAMQFAARLTAVTMCFFIAEGYFYTRNVKAYMKRLFAFSVISWPAYIFAFTGILIPFLITQGHAVPHFVIDCGDYIPQTAYSVYLAIFDVTFSVLENSVIFTLFLGLAGIYIWDRPDIPIWLKAAATVGIMYIASFGNWSYFGVLYCLIFYFFKDNAPFKWILFSAVSLLYVFNVTPSNPFLMTWSIEFSAYKLGVFLAPFFLLLYNGEPGKKSFFNKWFFYIFYPGHLFVMGVIGIMIGAFIHWI